MERYICIHGHFYQPARENPWLETVEREDSAHPYHDWNERVTAECYAPNAAARIQDGEGRVNSLVNNYARISFDFGPTLLAWLERNSQGVYEAILSADRESQKRFSGHGSAIAQAYNHMILPLANRRDKYTQVVWGIRDFQHRFGRHPDGMWLPETAVDLETLDIMAELGIQFTILTPRQASHARKLGDNRWRDVRNERIDPTMAYAAHLPSGRNINVFFYNAPVSRAVAFEHLLNNGEDLALRLMGAFQEGAMRPQLVHIATDGETYGHHHKFGEMALAYALEYLESNDAARLTNYSEYLDNNPPTHEARILQRTSWSCPHGVERWRADCGCNTGARPEWNRAWRGPLREALEWLRDIIAPKYEEKGLEFFKDPWAARNDYIEFILDRSSEQLDRYLGKHSVRPLNDFDRDTALKLLEMQRHTMLMFASDGWFFDDISGIETRQVLLSAGRVLQLGRQVFGEEYEPSFLKILEAAKSNVPAMRNGRTIYQRFVKPKIV